LRYARTQEAGKGVPVSLEAFHSYFLVLWLYAHIDITFPQY
jgi:hypothetical protein